MAEEAPSKSEVLATLENMWEQGASPDAMLKYLDKHEHEVSDRSELVLKRGWLHIRKKEFDKARALFNDGKEKYRDDRARYLLAIADSYVQSWHYVGEKDHKKKAHESYQQLIKEYPDFGVAYSQYSLLKLIEGDFGGVVKLAEKSNAIEETAYASRNLVIAYQRLGDPESSLNSLEKVHHLNQAYYSDKDMMLSAALAYADMRRYEESFGVVRTLLSKDEALKQDSKVQETVKAIRAKLIAEPNVSQSK